MGIIRDTDISLAEKIQGQLGIPVVMVNLPLTEMDKAYEIMGDLLGEKEKAEELGAYCRDTIAEIKAKAAQIPEDKKVRVYYAEGAKGLETEPQGSMHIETLEAVGGLNVASGVAEGGKGGFTPVSLEQVLAWNPDVIISWNTEQGGAYQEIISDVRWAELKAVKDKKVYEIPTSPYNWFDRPPSVNRIIGFKWLGNLLYPEVYQYDMIKEAKEFYKKFYHYDLSDEDAQALLANAQVRK
jgi:iron complex transport system substrate-binding protein